MDNKGNEVIPFIYDYPYDFKEGFATVMKNKRMCVIDKKGNVIIPPIYNYISKFYNGFAVVERDGKRGVIDKNGNEIISCIYDSIAPPICEGIVKVKHNRKWGVISLNDN